MSTLSYHGPVDLVLRYGEVPGLSRTVERPGVELEVSQPAPGQPAVVQVQQGLRLDLAKCPTSAQIQLPDGTVIAGQISQEGCYYSTFKIIPR